MIIELDTKLADLPQQLNMNQLVFLSMVLDDNHKNNQDVQKIVSLITDDEISYLVSQGLITSIERGNSITYQATDQLKNHLKPEKDWFDQGCLLCSEHKPHFYHRRLAVEYLNKHWEQRLSIKHLF